MSGAQRAQQVGVGLSSRCVEDCSLGPPDLHQAQ